MLNIFQQPWLLLIVSFVLLIAVYLFRQSLPDKRKWWQLLIPVICAGLAFAADHFVKTDHEKISSLMDTAARAVAQRDINAVEPLFAEGYSDRYHKSREAIMATCRRVMTRRSYENIVITYIEMVIQADQADIDIIARVKFNEQSAEMPAPYMFAKLKMTLTKKPDKTWVISRTDKVEINNNEVSW